MSHITADELQTWISKNWPNKVSFKSGTVTPTANEYLPTMFLNTTDGSISLNDTKKWQLFGGSTSFGKMFVVVDGLVKLRYDVSLKENPDFTIGVNPSEIDVMKFKNISLLSKGLFKGVIPSEQAILKDAKKGDWWKANAKVTLLGHTFNPGDEMFCQVDTVGVPADFVNFSIVPETSSDMSGASSVIDGAGGKVPQPLKGDEDKVLYGDGKWRPGGGAEIHDPTRKYVKGAYAMYKGLLVQAVDDIPVSTAFKWGTTGATWALVSSKTWKGVFAVGSTYAADDLVALTNTTWNQFFYSVSGVVNETKLPTEADNWMLYIGAAIQVDAFTRKVKADKGQPGLVPAAISGTSEGNVLSSLGTWIDPLVMTDKNTSKKWKLIVEDGKPYLTDEL